MTAGEKTTVINAAKTAIDNAIAAYFAVKTISAETRGYLTTGAPGPSGVGANVSLKGDVETALTAAIVVNE